MKDKITVGEVDWGAVAHRLIKFRELLGFNRETFAEVLGISLSKLITYEIGKERKSFGPLIEICQKAGISPRWLLTGEGKPFRRPDEEPLVDPMKVDKGCGFRRSDMRKSAEEGMMDQEMLEFVLSVDEFKAKNYKKFLSMSEIYQLVLYLGYRKVAPKSTHVDCLEI